MELEYISPQCQKMVSTKKFSLSNLIANTKVQSSMIDQDEISLKSVRTVVTRVSLLENNLIPKEKYIIIIMKTMMDTIPPKKVLQQFYLIPFQVIVQPEISNFKIA
ncbi:unnamed protein product (macronuclear) [Paramecium tetraurelia]|uniref:Uncharacterized protein n=1 Tax=Paramecium tetraurelia TaxID=5888 RepID=A0DBQ2_PARTE|nr:uncharacterized protein GSPATT00015366001 [Paramecium tetraurelia]CAK80469.1 unnamed protein product [Paramecium tetraurelia]|eukprot:XP_001447866.1 hypothetical protein (macronuclear) [Paramecium tetraurelia strain d4-2]